jgi:6-phosphogluconolactonase
MTTSQIEIYPDKTALVSRAASLVIQQFQAAIAQRNTCSIVLAGGSTPKPLYETLANAELPSDKLQIFWGDERYVPVDHADSNAGMAKAAWLDRASIPSDHVHIVPTHLENPAATAHAYEQTIQDVLGEQPQFDIVLLGMGDDGHTASLFPHTEALGVRDRLVTVGKKSGEPRITLTASAINNSRCVIFLVSGSSKQTALSQVFSPDAEDDAFPSRKIQPQGELWWLLDADAGVPVKDLPNAQVF